MLCRRSLSIAAKAMVLVISALAGLASGERLPVRQYTTADGLAGGYITRIDRDSRGFLWFATRDGLSRFDGRRFTTYGIGDGLPSAMVNSVLETRRGAYWIATNGGGVCRFNPRGRRPTPDNWDDGAQKGPTRAGDQLFTAYRVGGRPAMNRVNVLYEDRSERLWVGTDGGVFRLEPNEDRVEFRRVELPHLPADPTSHGVSSIVGDVEGSVWIGGAWGLTRVLPDGRAVAYSLEPKSAKNFISVLAFANERQLWVGLGSGLMKLDTDAASSFTDATHPIVRTVMHPSATRSGSTGRLTSAIEATHWYTSADGLPHDRVTSLYIAGDGRIWAGTYSGLAVRDGHRFRAYRTVNGLTDNSVTSLSGDSAGNIWIGTVAGVTRMIPHGFSTYDAGDGLEYASVNSLSQDEAGRVYVVSGDYGISRFDGTRFVSTRADLPPDARCIWMSPCGYLDRAGEWWMLSTVGLHRWSTVARLDDLRHRPPRAVYGSRRGLPYDRTSRVFEDRNGNLWIATEPEGLVEWHRSTGAWREYSMADGVPQQEGTSSAVSAFAEDQSGNLWVGFADGVVARLQSGRFQVFDVNAGAPVGLITALYSDRSGRLWIGTNQAGLVRVDEPGAVRPTFVPFEPTRGLNVRCVIEDALGQLYAGTSRGIYRIDPASGRMQHYGVGEGLASEFVTVALRSKDDTLWFGTISGLSRLDPTKEISPASPHAPLPVLISALRIRGVPQPLSELGEVEPASLTLAPDQNQLEVDFFALTFRGGESVRYQYRLEGVDEEWSRPTEVGSVTYGRLSAGTYRFLVRSIASDGAVGTKAASLSFRILPPIYARWWFVSLAALLVGAAGLLIYRARVAQLLRVERVRSRIATDLHDDLGASLSQIAILAEVARQRRQESDVEVADPLQRIAETSRGLVDSMSDIVWAINPEVDALSDLVHRMRRFADDTLSACDIDLTFHAPELRHDPKLGPDVRREIFLILKESVTNVAKHAQCGRVTIDLESVGRRIRLRIADDGRGFEPGQKTDGNGVASMRRRAATLGGHLTVESAPGHGTTILFEVDLRKVPSERVAKAAAEAGL